MAQHFTYSHLLFPFFIYLISFTSSALSDQLPSSFASTQIKFWSENVNNKMPPAISNKLSPLTIQVSDYYAKAITQDTFKADTKFCSVAKLACSTKSDEFATPLACSISLAYKYGCNRLATTLAKVDLFTFFRLSILKEGYTFHLPNLQKSLPFPAFLPPQIASKISLSPEGIRKIFPEWSKESIDDALSSCNAAAIKGESKACPRSLEETISFSKNALGKSKLLMLTAKSTKGSGEILMIKKIKKFNVENVVACHEMFLPFAAYFCHSVSSSRVYIVDLVEPKTGAPVNTVPAICHMDTSSWPEDHVSFKILKFGPGQGEICHWMSEIDLAWIADGENI